MVAAVGTAVALVTAMALANAASLPLVAQPMTAAAVSHPCQGTAAATAAGGSGLTYSAVSVTLPVGCAGLPLTMRMTDGSTVLSGTATVTASNVATVSFAPTTYNASSTWTVDAVVAGWAMPTTWSFTRPPIWCTVVTVGSTATCTATVTLFHGTKPGGGEFDYYDVEVTTASTAFVEWEVGFNLADPFYGTVPDTLGNSTLDGYYDGQTTWAAGDADVERVSQCSSYPGQLLVRGEDHRAGRYPNYNYYEDVRNGRVRRFSLVLNYASGIYDDLVDGSCSP